MYIVANAWLWHSGRSVCSYTCVYRAEFDRVSFHTDLKLQYGLAAVGYV